jgi:drug/metabolite transporter (DMT)-like permease
MGGLELILGVTMLAAAVQKESPHGVYKFAGALGLAFGMVLIAQPSSFDSVLGASRNTGWLYALLGLVFLGLGFGAPIVFERDVIRPIDQ